MAIYILGPDSNGDCCTCADRINVCDTCGAPTACPCSLVVPYGGGEYPDLSSAQIVLNTRVLDCYALLTPDIIGDSFSFDGTTMTINETYPLPSVSIASVTFIVSMSLGASQSVNLSYVASLVGGTFSAAVLSLIDCSTFSTISSDTSTASTDVLTVTSTSAGTYYLYFLANAGNFSSYSVATTTTSSGVFVLNPTVAQWDDGGTTRKIEACPKMLIPPLTESTGDWYANLSAAQTAISDYTSNCVGYSINSDTFTATDGGTSLTLSGGQPSAPSSIGMWGSINLQDGATVIFTHTASNQRRVAGAIYDYDGTVVDSFDVILGPNSGTNVLGPVPYTGRYIVSVTFVSDVDGVPLTGQQVITSSATLSVNTIQALYATSPVLDCPARLDC